MFDIQYVLGNLIWVIWRIKRELRYIGYGLKG